MMPELRARSAAAKVSENEYTEIEPLAASRSERGLVVSGKPVGQAEQPGAERRARDSAATRPDGADGAVGGAAGRSERSCEFAEHWGGGRRIWL